MSIDSDRERLSQAKRLEWLQRDLQMTKRIDVYFSSYKSGNSDSASSIVIYCALIPLDGIDRVLSSSNWDLRSGDGMPDASISYEGGEEKVEYLRYGVYNGIEPLVFCRDFYYKKYNGYMEICEEFRLFHKLYHDKKTDKYIKIDDEGEEHTVAVVKPDCVQIRIKELRQFLAIKEMYLSIQFDCQERSTFSLEELGLEQGETHQRNSSMRWCHGYGDSGLSKYKSCSRLAGKRLIKPLPKSKSGLWGFAEEPQKRYIEFMSKTYFKRQILAEFTDSDRPEHLFIQHYQDLQEVCKEYLGWQLLLPLETSDEHHFQGLRIPATDEQRDFDALVLSLTKILIDSLNEKCLNTLIPDNQKAELKGSIARLEAVLSSHDVEGAADCVSFLRKLQNLRSSSAAHRKGRSYRKIAKDFGVDSQSLRDVFTKILWQALDVLACFTLLVRSGQIEPEAIEQSKVEEGYATLDKLVGFCESDRTDGSVNHDEAIYGLRSEP